MRMLVLKTVLVATDLSDESLPAIRVAHMIAVSAGAVLHVVHIGSDERSGTAAHKQLGKLGVRLEEAAVHTMPGDPATGVVKLSKELDASVIVTGPHVSIGLGTSLQIATRADVPVLVVGKDARIPVQRVAVAVDGSETARGALVVALSWASGLREQHRELPGGTTLVVLHVDEKPEGPERHELLTKLVEQRVEKLRSDAGTWSGITIESVVVEGKDVPEQIAAYVNEHDIHLVVLGTRGVGLDAVRRLGSVSQAVADRVTVPVLLVPPAVWHGYAQSESEDEIPAEHA
jgi:nucleotide-binding universal stress UspA family protein